MRKKLGNHDLADQNCSSACTEPSSRPPIVATMIDCSPPSIAAPSAPTTSALSPIGVSEPCSGPTTIAENAASTAAMTQLISARRCGE